ncbi:UDP-glucose 4-epimerase GalE [Desulfovibrio sp. OttesenSCG-928-C14]|nr:UDP-glucose 4-epimerase GalE [Desulfovibrio sp. OttesenSCG-928-C14]
MSGPILIVGGAGYIGSHILRRLVAGGGRNCVVLDNLVHGHQAAVPQGIPLCRADLLDPSSLEDLFRQHRFQAVMHFASYINVGESVVDPGQYYQNNVAGSLNLLEAMRRHAVRDFIFSSSCAVYGNPLYLPLDEAHPYQPINPYGWSKFFIEQTLDDYARAYGLRYIALRYFNASGAALDGSLGESHHPETHLIPLVLKAIKGERDKISVFGTDYPTPDGSCLRDYIHVEDLALAHELALNKLSQGDLASFSGGINLGTGEKVSVLALIRAAEKITGQSCPVKLSARRPGDPAELWADFARAREILGWQPRFGLDEILESAWHWENNRKF